MGRLIVITGKWEFLTLLTISSLSLHQYDDGRVAEILYISFLPAYDDYHCDYLVVWG